MRSRTWAVPALLVGGVTLLAGAVLAPFAVGELSGHTTLSELSELGSAYAISAALMSSFAVLGALAAIVMQSSQLRLQQLAIREMQAETVRTSQLAVSSLHTEVLGLALAHPELAQVWLYDDDSPGNLSSVRLELYTNLVFTSIQSTYLAGITTDEQVRSLMYEILGSKLIREFWEQTNQTRERGDAAIDSARQARFMQICAEEYARRANAKLGHAHR